MAMSALFAYFRPILEHLLSISKYSYRNDKNHQKDFAKIAYLKAVLKK